MILKPQFLHRCRCIVPVLGTYHMRHLHLDGNLNLSLHHIRMPITLPTPRPLFLLVGFRARRSHISDNNPTPLQPQPNLIPMSRQSTARINFGHNHIRCCGNRTLKHQANVIPMLLILRQGKTSQAPTIFTPSQLRILGRRFQGLICQLILLRSMVTPRCPSTGALPSLQAEVVDMPYLIPNRVSDTRHDEARLPVLLACPCQCRDDDDNDDSI